MHSFRKLVAGSIIFVKILPSSHHILRIQCSILASRAVRMHKGDAL